MLSFQVATRYCPRGPASSRCAVAPGDADGSRLYYVMPFIADETLRRATETPGFRRAITLIQSQM
jgi:hypothetical protein